MLLSFLLLPFLALSQNSFPPLAQWREHLPYQGTVDLTASENKIYAATLYSLFSIEKSSKEITRFSRVSGLSETGISTIKFDPASQKLLIAYSNSNIDIMDAQGIHNIPELKRENISGDKNIYHIFWDNNTAYLSTGLGVILIDALKKEISDSWFIGNNGGHVKVNAFTLNNGFFYAATEEGLKKIPVTHNNPADFNNWEKVSGNQGLADVPAKYVVKFGINTIVVQNDSLFLENATAWNPYFANGWEIISLNVSENKLLVNQVHPNGTAQVVVLDAGGNVEKTYQNPGLIMYPKSSLITGTETWIADLHGGLSHWQGNAFTSYKLNSPVNVALGGMVFHNHVFYAAAGAVNDSWNYQYNRSGIFRFESGSWTNINQYSHPQLDSVLDFITLATDPRDGSVWAGSFGGGLVHIKNDNSLDIFKQNSPIGATVGDPGSYRVAGLAFDQEQNLWIANFGSSQQLHVLRNNGSWHSFTAPFFVNQNAAAQILIDDANQKWIQSPLGNGIMVFDHNHTIDNPADDRWRMLKQGTGLGNLPSNYVMSMAKDKSGFIWIGTDNGVAVFQCPQEVLNFRCEAHWPVIKEDAFANYLFKGEEVRSIAVDGADRKWMATSSGVWLISADGDKVLDHFNETNSPLLSNDVKSIAINGATGEVYFGTAKGISAYRAFATEAAESKDKVVVFPNPVPPAYNGFIGIRGLPENAVVKITETNGRLVFQGRALGGQMVWNGKDYQGRQAASGIYLVIAIDDSRQEKLVTKIVFVSK